MYLWYHFLDICYLEEVTKVECLRVAGSINDCVFALKYSLLLKIHWVSAVFNKGDVWLWEVMHYLNMAGIMTVC